MSNFADKWNGQNIPRFYQNDRCYHPAIIPVMTVFMAFDEETIYDLLPSSESIGWKDEFANAFAWAGYAYHVNAYTPSSRYGGIPNWFPRRDSSERRISEQSQVDRFLLLLDAAVGGLLDDHTSMNPRVLAEGMILLYEDISEYYYAEEGIEWELDTNLSYLLPYIFPKP